MFQELEALSCFTDIDIHVLCNCMVIYTLASRLDTALPLQTFSILINTNSCKLASYSTSANNFIRSSSGQVAKNLLAAQIVL